MRKTVLLSALVLIAGAHSAASECFTVMDPYPGVNGGLARVVCLDNAPQPQQQTWQNLLQRPPPPIAINPPPYRPGDAFGYQPR